MNLTDLPAADRVVTETLAEYGALAREAVGRYLPKKDTRPYLDALLVDYPARSGKMMRASLCIATACAFGARPEAALCTAASIELLHNASLIHDDIEDESDERRGRPTLHKLHGVALAMHAGDTLSLLALRPLKDNRAVVGERLSALLFEETERVAWETAEGQALDLGWTRDNRLDITEEDYLHMVLKKTCWFSTIHPCRAGALIGTRGRIDPDALVRYGFLFGAAFQIHDDWLNLSPGAKYGKERDGDLREGKRTLLLAHAVAHATSGERVEIARILNKARADKSESEIAWLRRVFERTGAFDHAQQMALGLAGAAQHEFDRVAQRLPRSRDREFLRAIPRWVLSRTH